MNMRDALQAAGIITGWCRDCSSTGWVPRDPTKPNGPKVKCTACNGDGYFSPLDPTESSGDDRRVRRTTVRF